MRRRFRKKRNVFIIFLFYIVLLIIVGVSYSYLYTSLNIEGEISGVDTNPDYTIAPGSKTDLDISDFSKTRWYESNLERTQYQFNVVNKGNNTYDSFVLTITFQYPLTNVDIWNYEYSLSNNILVITNNNYTLGPNDSEVINFIVGSNYSNNRLLSIKLEVNEQPQEIDLDKFLVVFNKTSGWGNYIYQYNIIITNKIGVRTNGWEIRVTLPSNTTYLTGWNALYEMQGNVLIIKNTSYNGRLNNNESASIGLQLQTDIINFIPTDIKPIVW
ncbi:MAG: hypothetical protein GX247_04865 [Mollicutes bacterium]|nr:hypothetical protein [Mollicutes bacterium]